MNNPPPVVIAIATTGVRSSLKQTIDSVFSQEIENLTLKIVAPASEIARLEREVTAEFSKQTHFHFLTEQNNGFTAALNQAFNESRSAKYFGWINDDDYLAPGAIRRAVAALEQSEALVAIGQLVYLNEKGKQVGVNRFGKLGLWSSRFGPNLTPQPGSLFRVDAIKEDFLLETNYKYAMDLDLWLKLRERGEFIFIKQPQAFMLWHHDATTVKDRKKALREALEIRKKYGTKFSQKILIRVMWLPTKIIAYLSLKLI